MTETPKCMSMEAEEIIALCESAMELIIQSDLQKKDWKTGVMALLKEIKDTATN